jgi:hypothetical protein
MAAGNDKSDELGVPYYQQHWFCRTGVVVCSAKLKLDASDRRTIAAAANSFMIGP